LELAPIRESTVSSNVALERLGLVDDHERVVQRAAADVGQRQDLEHAPVEHLVDHDLGGDGLIRTRFDRPDLLVMHVIFQDISTSRCGCPSTELEAS